MIWKINGKEIKIKLKNKPRKNASKLHTLARQLIKQTYPYDILLEEIYIPKIKLYLDFYIESRKIAYEIQGQQHFTHKSYFHQNRMDFLLAQNRDRLKRDIMEENGITLIELKFNEEEKWKDLIRNDN